MKITGTMINYYFHCKRQCYLLANRINMEENSEDVRIGRVLHEIRAVDQKNAEVKYENIALDKITNTYVEEFKKSDADVQAARMQLLFYLKTLEEKGITKEGRLIFQEKHKKEKIEKVTLNSQTRKELEQCIKEIEKLIESDITPDVLNKPTCAKCAYYDYCYI